jgi:phage repressor protein C with HTH and peptisase S24 domain
MNLAERLKSLRKEAGLTQKEIAVKLDILQEAYRRWENEKSNPTQDSLLKLAKVFNVSVSYLLGESNVRSANLIDEIMNDLNEERQHKVIKYAKNQLTEQDSIKEPIQLYKINVYHALSAGKGYNYTADTEDYDTVETDENFNNYDLATWIKGDSMEPEYHNYDVALIKYQPAPDYEGQICAIDNIESGDSYIKKVYIKKNHLKLVSLNEEVDKYGKRKYPDFNLSFEDNPRIIGKVIGSFTPLENF